MGDLKGDGNNNQHLELVSPEGSFAYVLYFLHCLRGGNIVKLLPGIKDNSCPSPTIEYIRVKNRWNLILSINSSSFSQLLMIIKG